MYINHTKEHANRRIYPFIRWLVLFIATTFVSLASAAPTDCPSLTKISTFHSQALQAFTRTYGQHYWLQPGRLDALAQELKALKLDGLDASDYQLAAIEKSADYLRDWGVILDCDAKLASHSYLHALSDLHFGRTRTYGADPVWYSPQLRTLTDPDELFALTVTEEASIAGAFAQARPELERYQHLRKAYEKALTESPNNWPYIPPGPVLSQGEYDARVGDLKIRLAIEGYYVATEADDFGDHHFNGQLAEALKQFQRRHNLQVDGKAGAATLRELNITPAERLAQIRTNLERLRWFSADINKRLLLVDIAAATIDYYADGELVWSGRAQVGQPERATPQLKSIITHVTVNPPWNIPTSIFLKDQLPQILQNPDYLQKRNIRVFDSKGQEHDATEVDWNKPERIFLRQDPGPGNALGKVVIRFSNPFAVYLHDTPSSWLFNTQSRFYSSGCVRVEDALTLTRILLETNATERNRAFEEALASGKSQNVHLTRGVPLVMAYWTADADSDGTVYYRPDIYQDDQRVLALLNQPTP